MYIVYRLRVTIAYQTRPDHVQLNSNIHIHTLRHRHQCAIQIIRTVVPKDQPIHQQLNAKVLQDQAVTTIAQIAHQPLARAQATTVTVQPLLVVCHMAPLIATIHTVFKENDPNRFISLILCATCANDVINMFINTIPMQNDQINGKIHRNLAAFSFMLLFLYRFYIMENKIYTMLCLGTTKLLIIFHRTIDS